MHRPDLAHLDGIRGVLALLVVLAHTGLYTGREGELHRAAPVLMDALELAEFAVPVFIVLSGFTLMISVARADALSVRGGWRGHVGRRAHRLMPPYFAALVVSVVLIATVPLLASEQGTQWDRKVPMTIESVVTHVLLVHNLHPDHIDQLNGSLWSIAVEWQIVLVMPLTLWLWRRTNAVVLIGTLALLGVASVTTGVLAWSAPFFPLLFGAGMLAAYWTQGPIEALDRRRGTVIRWVLRRRRVIEMLSALLVVGMLAGSILGTVPEAGTVIGLLTALLLGLEQEGQRLRARPRTVVQFLRLRPLQGLGHASYSIYLLHAPLLALGNLLLLPLQMPAVARFLFLLVTVVPATMLACTAFFAAVERRFLNSHQRQVMPTRWTLPARYRPGSRSRRTSGSPGTTAGR